MTDGLLLLHAWPVDARMWEPQRGALPADLTVVAPDLPGFGGAELAGDVTTVAAAAAAALPAVDAAGVERVVVGGLSFGGYVAFEIWRRARERVAGLILANTRAVADPEEAAAARLALAARLLDEGNVLAAEPPPLLAEDAPTELQEVVRSWIADQSPRAIAAALLGMAERPDSTPDLATIDVPTLAITSSGDRVIAPEISTAMAAKIPGARLEILEGVGHLSNLEAPDRFTELLVEQLAACGIR
ncbi:MAG: alpha/beta hydrolase [Actinobacteria bacterium]|nr:alpha/beta hydrolase [Actinomycetota bacterium]